MNMNTAQHQSGDNSQHLTSETFMMKSYIDFKFEELEKKVINLIEDKDKINQAKLDRIINLLETNTSFEKS